MQLKSQMTPKQKAYNDYVNQKTPNTKLFSGCVKAFLVGGIICTIGEGVSYLGRIVLGYSDLHAAAFTAIVMVFLGALLTGLGIYDRIGKFAGAGSIVPITGFANSIVAPAMEFKSEGLVLGVGAKLFTLAGPVLVYGISASIVVGLIYLVFNIS
ncbi:stage V sporulation protein AC [Christensenellaceae bacterium NSJ-44]|uniref:Stage V sporulation protein AC n=1 Tax=Luoshenia tenuis TaxID=2763654 RepID=A0A926HMX3_9FIRM|nr:stage V sporulation protein AC [Luoshenia tenuis]MBC8529593.1 stage V sporulation protein AC [Luoshenia tenuis]